MNLGFDVVDRVARLHLEGDGFAREGLDEAVCGRDERSATYKISMAVLKGYDQRGRGGVRSFLSPAPFLLLGVYRLTVEGRRSRLTSALDYIVSFGFL